MRYLRQLFLLLCLSLGGGLLADDAQAELVVIVNARAGVATMTRLEIANLFFGRSRQFFNGQEAQPVDLAESHADRAHFYQWLVNQDLAQVDSYWSRQIFSGSMQPPPRVATPEEVIKRVVAHPGGIGYVDTSRVDARVRVVHEFTH